jgi:hypothetical protein
MGIGAAGIFPATLAIITNLFTDTSERAEAIGIWSAMSGVGVAAGPIGGGWLLEHFWWGSVFFVNVLIVLVTMTGAWFLVPESRDDDVPRIDMIGLVLSIAAIGALVFTIIEAPEFGWLAAETLIYTPLEAGVRTLPVAVSIAAASVLSPRLVDRIGTKLVVAGGLGSMAIGFFWVSTASASTPYLEIVGQMIFLGAGLGATTAPATESIMGSLPIIGSVFSSVYVQALADGPIFPRLPEDAQDSTRESIVAAGSVARELGADAPRFVSEISDAFLSGLSCRASSSPAWRSPDRCSHSDAFRPDPRSEPNRPPRRAASEVEHAGPAAAGADDVGLLDQSR